MYCFLALPYIVLTIMSLVETLLVNPSFIQFVTSYKEQIFVLFELFIIVIRFFSFQ